MRLGWLACCLFFTTAAGAQESELEKIQKGMRDASAELNSARARGTFSVTIFEKADSEAQEIVRAEIDIVYQQPRFLVKVKYDTNRSQVKRRGQTVWRDSKLEERQVLFDGKLVYIVDSYKNGEHRGQIRSESQLDLVFVLSGFPKQLFCLKGPPINDRRLRAAEVEALSGGNGWLCRYSSTDNLITQTFYILGNNFLLKRTEVRDSRMPLPLLEQHFTWANHGGCDYIQRYVHVKHSPFAFQPDRVAFKAISDSNFKRTTSVEYEEFLTNPSIDESEFELNSLNAPGGTRFESIEGRLLGPKGPFVLQDGQLHSAHEHDN